MQTGLLTLTRWEISEFREEFSENTVRSKEMGSHGAHSALWAPRFSAARRGGSGGSRGASPARSLVRVTVGGRWQHTGAAGPTPSLTWGICPVGAPGPWSYPGGTTATHPCSSLGPPGSPSGQEREPSMAAPGATAPARGGPAQGGPGALPSQEAPSVPGAWRRLCQLLARKQL